MEFKIKDNAAWGVIGYGSWATALAGLLTKSGNRIGWYIRNREVLEGLQAEGHNPKYISELEFDRNLLNLSDDINKIVSECDILLVSVPSAYLTTFLEPLEVPLKNKFVISAIKGIIPGDYSTVAEFFHDKYSLSYGQLGIIAGPSHAEEVSRGKLSYLTVVCTDPDNAKTVSKSLQSDSLITHLSSDLYGTEYAAILKNIYAIAAGIAEGLGYGDNFKAVLAAASAGEMTRFINESYPFVRDTMESAYLGDLLVTCYSTYSRNRRLGLLIGHGCTVKSALNEMTMIAEGYFASECIHIVNKRYGIRMPVADMVYDILYCGAYPRKRMKELTAEL